MLCVICCFAWYGFDAARFGGGVNPMLMEGQVESCGKIAAEYQVFICLSAAQTVMEVRGVQYQAQFSASLTEREKQRNRVCTTRETDGDTLARSEL